MAGGGAGSRQVGKMEVTLRSQDQPHPAEGDHVGSEE